MLLRIGTPIHIIKKRLAPGIGQFLGNSRGNPWVSQLLPIPIPAKTLTRDPAGFYIKMRPKTSKMVEK